MLHRDAEHVGTAGQEFLLFLIKLPASREERTRNYSPMSFIPALKNKTRWKGPARTKIFFLPPGFSAALRDKAARQFTGNSLTQVSSGKKRRKFCPLFPCKPDLVPLGGIAAGGRATAGGQVLAAGSQARHEKRAARRVSQSPFAFLLFEHFLQLFGEAALFLVAILGESLAHLGDGLFLLAV